MTDFPFRLAIAGALLAGATPAIAGVLALAPTTRGDNLHVVDIATHNSTVLEASACCAVQVGSVAADTVNHRVFFLANHAGGTADLYTFGYGAGTSVSSVPIGGAARISHLAYDAAHARLVGLTSRDDQGVDVVTIAPATGNVVVAGSPGPTCCTLRAGVSAYQSASSILYAVGRRSTDTSDHLLAFSVDAGTLQNAWDLGTEQIAQLVAEGSTLYALSSVRNTTALRVGTFALTPAFQFNAIGSGADDCCFVLAGSATIDHANNALVALTRASGTSGIFSIRKFSLSSGNATTGSTLQAMGLFEDSAVLFDRIFADGFEVNPVAN
jgi:hypothetical protein